MTDQKKPARRGRPPKGMTPAEMSMSRAEVETPREEQKRVQRPRRIAMQARKKLDFLQQDPNFYYRWMQDRDGRIEQAKEAGYEFVLDGKGEGITRRSGPYSLHLMRLPKEWREEDNRAKQAKVIETIKEKSEIGEDEYIPEGHRHVIQKDGDFDPLL